MNAQIIKLIDECRESPSPGRLSEICVELSSYFATLAQQLEDIEVFMADRWMDLRNQYKTNSETDRAWNATDEGKQRIRLRSQLKYIEKTISSIKMRLRVKEGESYGRY